MAAAPKDFLTGFNHNVRHKGQGYHVQTEDSGEGIGHVLTHLFQGGNILASKKTSYQDLRGTPDLKILVRALMEEQHRQMLRELVNGAFDPPGEAVGDAEAEAAKEAKGRAQPSSLAEVIRYAPKGSKDAKGTSADEGAVVEGPTGFLPPVRRAQTRPGAAASPWHTPGPPRPQPHRGALSSVPSGPASHRHTPGPPRTQPHRGPSSAPSAPASHRHTPGPPRPQPDRGPSSTPSPPGSHRHSPGPPRPQPNLTPSAPSTPGPARPVVPPPGLAGLTAPPAWPTAIEAAFFQGQGSDATQDAAARSAPTPAPSPRWTPGPFPRSERTPGPPEWRQDAPAETIFGENLISEKSLDEVILHYLAGEPED